MVYLQIEDIGFCAKGDLKFFEQTDFTFKGQLPIQTGGGIINCGQPSTAGGVHHILEGVRLLRVEGCERQVPNAKIGLISGLGVLPFPGSGETYGFPPRSARTSFRVSLNSSTGFFPLFVKCASFILSRVNPRRTGSSLKSS